MKRTPLVRRAPLKASPSLTQGGTSRSGELKRTGRVNPQSAKRRAAMTERRALVAQLLAESPRCQARWVCAGARSVDVHERLKRSRGGSITDPVQAHMVTLCRACHEMTEAEPAEATRRRMLLPSWHVCPPVGPC